MRLKTALLGLTQREVNILLAYGGKEPPDPTELFRIEDPIFPEEKLYAFGRLHELGLLQGGMPPEGESGDIRADRARLTPEGHYVLKDLLGYNDAASGRECGNAFRSMLEHLAPTVTGPLPSKPPTNHVEVSIDFDVEKLKALLEGE